MDIEELNKSQLILLALLVSFVTSIATGIVTVALIEKAPTDVTRVVQKVVERTVEKVTPGQTVTKEKVVMVREGDLITQSIASNSAKIIKINDSSGALIALGVAVSSDTIVTDASAIKEGEKYSTENGAILEIISMGGVRSVAVLKSDKANSAVSLSTAVLGQNVFMIDSAKTVRVLQGTISEIGEGGVIYTTIDVPQITSGTSLFSADGLVGISTSTSRANSNSAFMPSSAINAAVSAKLDSKVKEDNVENANETSKVESLVTPDAQTASVMPAIEPAK